eukprot:10733377-Ditylum_brightwellii.AAC.1
MHNTTWTGNHKKNREISNNKERVCANTGYLLRDVKEKKAIWNIESLAMTKQKDMASHRGRAGQCNRILWVVAFH